MSKIYCKLQKAGDGLKLTANSHLVCTWPTVSQMDEAIGYSVKRCLQLKNDYGKKVSLSIDLQICYIDEPTINF